MRRCDGGTWVGCGLAGALRRLHQVGVTGMTMLGDDEWEREGRGSNRRRSLGDLHDTGR